jgi:hypothetical protein
MLEAAFGIPDTPARHIGIYWGCGDELYYDDGRSSGTGNGHAFLLYVRHPIVEPALAGVHLGSCDRPADHWLLLDRQEKRLSVAPVAEARQFLFGQWPPTEPMTLTDEEWDAVVERLRSVPPPSGEQIAAMIQQQRRVEMELRDWLDSHPRAISGREAFMRFLEGRA